MSTEADTLPTAERFLQMLIRSGLFRSDDVRSIVEQAPAAVRGNAKRLADYLVERQQLTHFQAAKLLQGTYQGLVLGPFQVLAALGRGGMGQVYLARNTLSEKAGAGKIATLPGLVALKVLPPKKARGEDRMLARFLREMDMCQRVDHPHVTKTFDAGEIQGVNYIAMEYIRGWSLKQVVKNSGPLPTARAARLFSEVAAGLMHAHEKGLIHRDLKPSNIMVTPNGHAKILDLGLALAIDEELPQDKSIVGGQGYVVGTMDYIAPEQVGDSAQVDGRADLYSLGCTIYYAMSGQTPFPGGTSIQKMKRHRKEFAEPLNDLNPTIPVEFARIVEKLMEKDPARRYRSAAHVRAALLPWITGDPDKPMDTDPMMSEAEALDMLEREQSAEPGLWWESVPGISFEATAKYSSKSDARNVVGKKPEMEPARIGDTEDIVDEPAKPLNPLFAVGLIGVGLVAIVLLLQLLRRL